MNVLFSKKTEILKYLLFHSISKLNSLRPEVDLMGTDMANIRSGVTRLTKAVNAGKKNTRKAEKRRHFIWN
jgi:hypothetical protein